MKLNILKNIAFTAISIFLVLITILFVQKHSTNSSAKKKEDSMIYSPIDEKYIITLLKSTLKVQGTITVEKLTSGFSGAPLFTATTDSKKYVVRFLKHKSTEERAREIAILKIASKTGYGPEVYFADIDQGVIIMEFLMPVPITPDQWQKDKPYVALAHLAQKIHHGPHFDNTSNIFEVIQTVLIQDLKAKNTGNIPLAKIEQSLTDIQRVLAAYMTSSPCHNDLHPSNIIFLGDKFKAIDYELAAQSDPYFDIAMITVFYCDNPASEKVFLSTYFQRQLSATELAKLYLMKQVARIYCALCFLKMVPEQLQNYEKVSVPSYGDFMKEAAAGKINLENHEHKLKFAKILINLAFDHIQSQEFGNVIKVLNK